MTPRTWTETLVFLDGHVHDEAKDCAHRKLIDACRVCCPHDGEAQAAPAATEPSEWRDDPSSSARALVRALAGLAVAALVIVVSVLTLAGVIPS